MRRKRTGGQAVLELAILFPFFLLILVGGIIDFGFAFYNLLTLQQLANDAALYAAEGNGKIGIATDSEIQTYVNERKPFWWAGNVTVSGYQEVAIDGGNAKVKRVFLTYVSPMFTPFYQIMMQTVSSTPGLTLSVLAAYQVPNVVAVR